MKAFPWLLDYKGCWLVNDIMMLYLKNTSQHEKLKAQKLAAELAAEAVDHRGAKSKGKGRAREILAEL